jgi:hypothetical protein
MIERQSFAPALSRDEGGLLPADGDLGTKVNRGFFIGHFLARSIYFVSTMSW